MNHEATELIGRLSAVSDREVTAMTAPGTRHDLAERIMATPREPAAPARSRTRRRLLAGIPVAVGLTAAAVTVTSLTGPGGKVGPPPAQAAALSFSQPAGGYITVQIKDPYADPARYGREFAAHRMRIDLSLVPASPSIVGTLTAYDPAVSGRRTDRRDIRPVEAKGACRPGGGGDLCPIGVKIPVGYRDHAMIVFGRAARPGEPYATSAPITAPGEMLHGLAYRNRTVDDVTTLLRKRGITIVSYRAEGAVRPDGGTTIETPKSVPGAWYVHHAVPYADHQVFLFVGPQRNAS